MGIIIFVLGELVPASIGERYAAAVLKWTLPLMHLLILVFKPLVGLLTIVSKIASAPFGSEMQVNTVTEEEIMTFVEGGTLEDEEKEMIYSVLQLDEKLARDVMVPRIDVVGLEITSTVEKALERFIKSGFSRIPVYEEIIDNIKGVLYAKDLLTYWHNGKRDQQAIQSMLRPAYFVPESRPAGLLLQEMKVRKVHIAIVVDEYGGTAGLITIEDLIEQIIGDIQDEYDLNEEDEYRQIGDDEFVVDAGINIDLFNDVLEVELPSEESNTLGGFIYAQIGRIPEVGDTITTDEITLRVESLERRRIRKVYVRRHTTQETEPSEGQETNNGSGVPLPTVIKDADKPLAFSR
jgi:CBS domain containing-hemolysin-like protein